MFKVENRVSTGFSCIPHGFLLPFLSFINDIFAIFRSCDVVVHEATHDDTLVDKAVEFGHSTPSQAVAFSKSVGAKVLLLNHFSQRYSPSSKESLKVKLNSSTLRCNCGHQASFTLVHSPQTCPFPIPSVSCKLLLNQFLWCTFSPVIIQERTAVPHCLMVTCP